MMSWSIKQTIAAVVVAVFLVFTAVISVIMIHDTKSVMLDAFTREQQAKVDILGFSVSRAIEKDDYELLQYVVGNMKKDPAVISIAVLDVDGETVVRYPNEEDDMDADLDLPASPRINTILYPLLSQEKVIIGQLRLVTSNEIINSSVRHEIGLGLGVLGILGTLFVGLIFFFLNRIITSPLVRLSRAVAGQSATSSQRTEIPFQKRIDEIGTLAKAFGLVFAELNYTTSELKRSEGRLQAILDHSPAIISLQDQRGNYLLINRGGEELYNTTNQIVGKTDYELVSTEMANERQRQNKTIIKTGKDIKVEESLQVNGQTHTFLTIKFPLLNVASEVTAVCSISTDITNRKRDEADLARLAQAIGQVTEMIIISDNEGVIQYVNPAFEEVTGQKSTEVLGRHLDLFNRQRKGTEEEEEARWQDLLAGKIWQGRVVNKQKNGSFYEAETIISPVRDPEGRIINFVAVSRDITKEIRLEAQILQGQKLKAIGELAAGIAHEINTPIQYIGDNLRFVQDSFSAFKSVVDVTKKVFERDLDDAGADRDIEGFKTLYDELDVEYLTMETPLALEQSLLGIQRVIEIIAAMKNFAHPGSVNMTFVNLNAAIVSTIAVARNEWKHVAVVTTNLDQNLPSVPCLPGELNQVFLNFLINAVHAIKATAQAGSEAKMGQITITTTFDGKWVEIIISDTGTGIADEDKSRIFDPFFTTKEIGEGTGQGLAIANNVIVQKHHGVIAFDSKLGSGTTFTLKLPLEQEMSE